MQVKTDDQVEVDEAFSIVLQPAGANTALTGTTASATITNDDTGFSIVATDADKARHRARHRLGSRMRRSFRTGTALTTRPRCGCGSCCCG